MSSGLTILSVSADLSLLTTRRYLLEHWGYHVWSATSDHEALALLDKRVTFDLVLVCHSLQEPRRVALVAAIKELCPRLPILMLQGQMAHTDAAVTLSCESHVPEDVLNAIKQLTTTGSRERCPPPAALFVAGKQN